MAPARGVGGLLRDWRRRRRLSQLDVALEAAVSARHLSFVDYSAIAALMTLRERYTKAGKHLRVLHLSERCKKLLKRARVNHD